LKERHRALLARAPPPYTVPNRPAPLPLIVLPDRVSAPSVNTPPPVA